MCIASSQNYTTDGFLIQVANDGQLRLVGPLSGGGYFEQSAGPSLFDEWNHVAVVRTSGTIKGFVNGIEVISASQGTTFDISLGGSLNEGLSNSVNIFSITPHLGHIRLPLFSS